MNAIHPLYQPFLQFTDRYLFKQGATLVPRNLCFVKPTQTIEAGDTAFNPTMETDPDVNTDAKVPWKGMRLEGPVYAQTLYATLLSKNMMPFGYRKLHLVALPVQLREDGKLRPMDEDDFFQIGHPDSWESWFVPADAKWDAHKKGTSQFPHLIDRYNYQQTLTKQHPSGVYKVLYNSTGGNISACVINTHGTPPKVYEYPTQGFIVDYKTYHFDTQKADEANYLCAILNAPCVNAAIKAHQPSGTFGARGVERTPFEACAIPRYDAKNADHMALASLSRAAHTTVAATVLTGQVVMARRQSRSAVESTIGEIDAIARRVLGL